MTKASHHGPGVYQTPNLSSFEYWHITLPLGSLDFMKNSSEL